MNFKRKKVPVIFNKKINMIEWTNWWEIKHLTITSLNEHISPSSKKTESSENETSSNDATSENENDQLGKVENKDWCKCGQCKKEIREIDILCCTEVPAIIEEKFEGKKCVTLPHEVQLLCLNKTILKNVLVGLCETGGNL